MDHLGFCAEGPSARLSVVPDVHVGRHGELGILVVAPHETRGAGNVGEGRKYPPVDSAFVASSHFLSERHG